MISQRPTRDRKRKMIWEAVEGDSIPLPKRNSLQTPKTSTVDLLKPVILPSLSSTIKRVLPSYTPQINIRRKKDRTIFSDASPIDSFKDLSIQLL
jgi:hypothetical protein